ncbi:hypothetical protein JTE90_000011 [Oedothorax gibbosus]|uniref:Uncharacterized protein n=1 Tax=Oedothorax gibbosus TaxID=931172 RepID=A0AAV6TVJ7_9ARAC|nr:hypothetical protein JTE90_000011 [Oedothorax gibbosus]
MSSRSYLSGSAKRKRKRERDIAKNKNSRIDLFMKQKSEFVNSAPATETIDENKTYMVSGVSIIPEVSNVGSPIKTLSSNEENFKNKDSETGVERFLKCIPITSRKSETLSEVALQTLSELNLANCRGQSYDNSSSMAGRYSGLQARLKSLDPLADFLPCAAHSLNSLRNAGSGPAEVERWDDVTDPPPPPHMILHTYPPPPDMALINMSFNFGISMEEFNQLVGANSSANSLVGASSTASASTNSHHSGVNAASTSNLPTATSSNNSRVNAPAIIYSPIFGPHPPAAHTRVTSPSTIPKTLAPSFAPTFVHASPSTMPRTPSATPALAYDLPSTSAGP